MNTIREGVQNVTSAKADLDKWNAGMMISEALTKALLKQQQNVFSLTNC